MADMALRRHTHAFGLPPVVQATDNIQIFPFFRGKEDGRLKHIKKQPALGFLKVQAAFFQIRRMSGVQAAFYALCYAADAANFWRGGHLLPLPWERAGVRAFRVACQLAGGQQPKEWVWLLCL